MDLGIDGNTALVTASSSGLGKASAYVLAREGANVVINGRNKQKLDESVVELNEDTKGRVVGKKGDITKKQDIDDLISTTLDEFGSLDHIVTSAGGPQSGDFLEKSDEEWYEAFDLLVMSVVRLIRESAPYLKDGGGGTIVNITSRSVKEALESLVLSNSVRMSVIGLEKTLSRELAPEIRVNAVLPGSHETPRIEELIEQGIERGDYESYEEGLNDRSKDVPLERIGDPQELGELVGFLSSDKASFINGVAIPIDGGVGRSNL